MKSILLLLFYHYPMLHILASNLFLVSVTGEESIFYLDGSIFRFIGSILVLSNFNCINTYRYWWDQQKWIFFYWVFQECGYRGEFKGNCRWWFVCEWNLCRIEKRGRRVWILGFRVKGGFFFGLLLLFSLYLMLEWMFNWHIVRDIVIMIRC